MVQWLNYSLFKHKARSSAFQNLINGPPLIRELERWTWAHQDMWYNQINSREMRSGTLPQQIRYRVIEKDYAQALDTNTTHKH